MEVGLLICFLVMVRLRASSIGEVRCGECRCMGVFACGCATRADENI
jgi:hypothetical protein